ncbi:MAG TPA: ABC transporter substrate-binding protein [Xanthobacteraceae bacterium]|nr:ABC transporter substrate-binding protein [Xanthobacteraceae bacterium]
MHASRRLILGLIAGAFLLPAASAQAQTKTVHLAKQFGISYLPLTIMEAKGLLEAHGKKLGLDLKTEWVQFTGGPPMNEAIISGNLDFASGGVGPLLTIWGKTRTSLGVKGVAALNSMPLYLNTINPNVKTIKDFTDKDRIALPAVKVSIQAITLQMAAEKAFGPGQQNKLDALTASLGHPDGLAAMMSGKSEITAHFTSAPFMYQELEDSRVHKVLDSYDVLGGPHTFNVVWATTKFHDENPKIIEAFIAALDDAMKQIAANPSEAAAIWVKAENSKLTPAYIEKLIRLPENEWTMVPKKIMVYAEFMSRTGTLSAKPGSWRDVFFADTHKLPGS